MNTTGTYPFNLFTTLGCDSVITYELIVHPIPSAPIISSNSPLDCPGDVFELSVNTTSDAFYTWLGPNGFTSTEESLFFAAEINDLGTYSAMVTVNGCESPLSFSDLEIINIYSFDDFEFPNVLTPNDDNINEAMDLEGYFKTCNAYEMMYFDRWGNMVYSHKENEVPFTGNSLDGSALMQGVYSYKLIYEDGIKQGFIHLIR
jgi:gliding motility-associated-like protein